ncbi:MAG: hypothetical protein ABIT71_07605 [Vicinamibacteraceae bacterium]
MSALRLRSLVPSLAIGLIALGLATARPATAQTASPAPSDTTGPAPRDGSHDFDWMVGNWKADLKRLVKPLTGSTTWVEYSGTQTTTNILAGKAVMDEFIVDSPAAKAKIEALTIRLYNPANQTWSIYWANAANGTISMPPTVGRWTDGRGEFYDHEELNGRWILVRFTWSDITPTSAHFEQAFSVDGGKTWEANWISNLTRAK